jgi:hypothetical protein
MQMVLSGTVITEGSFWEAGKFSQQRLVCLDVVVTASVIASNDRPSEEANKKRNKKTAEDR